MWRAKVVRRTPDPEKNERIRQKRRETLERRRTQEARTYELKLDRSKISKGRLTLLARLFLEAKWFTNHVIARGITTLESDKDYKLDRVPVKVGEAFEERELLALSSQMKQALIKRLQDSVSALAQQKKKGMKVGRIKFVRRVRSIPLMQYKNTYNVDMERKRVRIQNLGEFRVEGLDQIPEGAELATANLIERNGDYYLHVTAYVTKTPRVENKKAIGIDLGIRDQAAFSNGVKLAYSVPVSKRLRRLYRWFSRAKKGSKRRGKILVKIRREFEYENNAKRDIVNKVAHYVTGNYEYVVFQADDIHSWQRLFGKRICEAPVGGLRDALRRKASTPIEVDRFTRTTGVCPLCCARVELSLWDREFTCPSCGSRLDRDVASAQVIRREGLCLRNIGETPGDERASALDMLEYFARIPHVRVSVPVNREAPPVRVG